MQKSYLHYLFNLQYVLASLLVMVAIGMLAVISELLPDTDETSFLTPIVDRLDFLNVEDISLDVVFALKDTRPSDKRLVIVNVGEVAPAPDGKIAMLLYKLREYGARAIGIDVIFDRLHFERFTEERQGEIDALKQAFADVPNTVIVNGYSGATLRPAFTIDPEVASLVHSMGFANLTTDRDDVVRRFWPYRTIDGERWLSFPVSVLRVYDSSLVAPLLDMSEEPQVIFYSGTYQQFQTVPIDDVVFSDHYKSLFRDAIVLVGFVNEGGLYFLDDTHKTPMGRKTVRYDLDGSTITGVEGPDMPGILIHANVINMLLTGSFIRSASLWVEWFLVFILSYLSIALYRVLRTKASSNRGVGMLITGLIVGETVMVFFLPIISFFYFDVRISYNLMATAVLLFIPMNAVVGSLRFRFLRWSVRHISSVQPAPGLRALVHAFDEEDPFPANIRLQYAALVQIHVALAVELSRKHADGAPIDRRCALPFYEEWIDHLPSLLEATETMQFVLQFLSSQKTEILNDSAMKDLFFSKELRGFNEFHHLEEWETLLPQVVSLFTHELHDALHIKIVEQTEGTVAGPAGEQMRLDPFIVRCDCKLHRTPEWFIFAGITPKQHQFPPYPRYFGEIVSCEPVLPPFVLQSLKTVFSLS